MIPLLFLLTSWNIEIVSTNASNSALVLDSSSVPYTLIAKSGYLILYYKKSGVWVGDTFESNYASGAGIDITIDKYNRVWCIYGATDTIDPYTVYVIVAHKEMSIWKKDTIYTNHYYPLYAPAWNSIITDSSGNPHVAYVEAEPGWIWWLGCYAYLQDTLWQRAVVDSFVTQYWCSIDIDSRNRPHISYFQVDPSDLSEDPWHAKSVFGWKKWKGEEIEDLYYYNYCTSSIRIDSEGLPRIAYVRCSIDTSWVKYAWYDTMWHNEVIEAEAGFHNPKALDIDSVGKPYIVYLSDSGFVPNTTVAYKENSTWHKVRLPSPNPPLQPMTTGSLRIARDGTIHLTRIVVDTSTSNYREVQYIYGTPEGVKESEKLMVKGERLRFEVSPNIVRHNVQFQYSIPEKQRISLRLYDVIGRSVETIAEGVVSSGTYSYIFDASNLNQGVYFLILEGEKETNTEKVLVVR